jgi:NAD(P)-dependent dehydrogenase (short-subunit alcohol dehydrogenase family)
MISRMFDLKGHVSLVTGGNSGIGLAMARGIAKAGGALALWGRNPEKNAAAAAELRALGADAEAFACDVADEGEIVRAMQATLARFGRVDSCFANAGTGVPKPFVEMTRADFTAVLDVNLTGVFLTFREAVRHMVARGGGGKLVATSSIGSMHGMPRQPNYAASKAGVIAMVRSLAVELGKHDIQANAILPGWIETDMTAGAMAWKKLHDTIVSRTPAGRWGKPEEFEAVAVYLAAKESRFHNGDVLRLDGGYCIF